MCDWEGCINSSETAQLFWVAKVRRTSFLDVEMSQFIGCTCRTHPLALADLWLWRWLMGGWPSISPSRSWAPDLWPFTGPGWDGCCQEPRGGATDPTTFPSMGDSCSAKEPGDATLPCHAGRTASNFVSEARGDRKPEMIHLWMSHSCKYPLHMMLRWPVQDKSGDMSSRA